MTLRELALSPYFFLCRYTLLISMCLQKLMNIHHCVFKILGKNQSVTDGHTDRKTDGSMDRRTTWKQYTPPQTKFAGGIINSNARIDSRVKVARDHGKCLVIYGKIPKYSDTRKNCCKYPKIWAIWLNHRVMSPKDAAGMANSVHQD